MISVAAIVGPTAVGKTALAARVAPALGAEIVSIDSMQAYRGMDVGTAKPEGSIRSAVTHHMIDAFDPNQEVTVMEFRARARRVIEEIAARGRMPLLVGGSGLYFRAVVDDLDFPPRSAEVRARLEAEAEEVGAETLHARLATLDARAAQRIEPENARRTVRALEVIELTGRPFSEADAFERYESIYDLKVVGLTVDRDALYERIAQRVDAMIEKGLIDEVHRLEEQGLSRTARQALGYRQVLESSPADGVDVVRTAIVRATKRFARRQESWFKADHRVVWVDASDPDVDRKVLAALDARGVEGT